MNIEDLAKKLFEYYGLRETGVRPDWRYLKKERQLAWMEDVHLVADALVSQLKEKVKPIPLNQKDMVNTTYYMGMRDGINQECITFINLVQQLEQDIEDQLFLFKEGMDDVQK